MWNNYTDNKETLFFCFIDPDYYKVYLLLDNKTNQLTTFNKTITLTTNDKPYQEVIKHYMNDLRLVPEMDTTLHTSKIKFIGSCISKEGKNASVLSVLYLNQIDSSFRNQLNEYIYRKANLKVNDSFVSLIALDLRHPEDNPYPYLPELRPLFQQYALVYDNNQKFTDLINILCY